MVNCDGGGGVLFVLFVLFVLLAFGPPVHPANRIETAATKRKTGAFMPASADVRFPNSQPVSRQLATSLT
jgi:hypothetical protein